MGRFGRPFTILIVVLLGVAIMAWSRGMIYDKMVSPVLRFLGTDVGSEVVDHLMAWASLGVVVALVTMAIIYAHKRLQRYDDRLLNN